MKNDYSKTIKTIDGYKKEEDFNMNTLKIVLGVETKGIPFMEVDGQYDLGIDYFIFKKNGSFINDMDEFSIEQKDKFEIYLVQTKYGNKTINETTINKVNTFLDKLVNNSFSSDELKNEKLAEQISLFKEIENSALEKDINYKLMVKFILNDNNDPSVSLKSTLDIIESKLFDVSCLDTFESLVEILNAKKLFFTIKRNTANLGKHNIYAEEIISIASNSDEKAKEDNGAVQYNKSAIALVKLSEIKKLFEDFDVAILDENVRKYKGNTKVNKSIAKTIEDKDEIYDFWNFNNGITICVDQLDIGKKVLAVTRPMIIDGGQTSYTINKFSDDASGEKKVIVKIINVTDPDKRNSIVESNNNKNNHKAINKLSILPEQYLIEQNLMNKGYYYERIENGYSINEEIDETKIISIEDLVKSFVIVYLLEPFMFRSSKASFFSEGKHQYKSVFEDHQNNTNSYIKAFELFREYDEYLKKNMKDYLKEIHVFEDGDKTSNDVMKYAALSNLVYEKISRSKPINSKEKFLELDIEFEREEIIKSFDSVKKIMETQLKKDPDHTFVNMIKSLSFGNLLE